MGISILKNFKNIWNKYKQYALCKAFGIYKYIFIMRTEIHTQQLYAMPRTWSYLGVSQAFSGLLYRIAR